MKHIKLGAMVTLCLALIVLSETTTRSQSPKPAYTVVEIHWQKNGRLYKVDGQQTNDLLDRLGTLKSDWGSDHPIVIFVDSRFPMREIVNFQGTADKAQLDSLRFFIFNEESRRMSEIKIGRSVPFSTDLSAEYQLK